MHAVSKLINSPFKDETVAVPRSKHSASVIKTNKLMLYREIIAVCSQIHAKHIKRFVGRTQNFFMLKLVVHNVLGCKRLKVLHRVLLTVTRERVK